MNTFDAIWSDLLTNLKVGTEIKNWTAFRGYLGDSMKITSVRKDYIEVKAPKAINPQIVPRDDFQKVWDVWKDYNAQKVQRQEVRDMTRFSKYIISIFHWLENA